MSNPEVQDGAAVEAEKKTHVKLPYFIKEELWPHNLSTDCWVSYFDKVYNLTPLIAQNKGVLAEPILKFAGQDITHWFDSKTRQPKTWIDPTLGIRVPYCPYGRYIHIPPTEPLTTWDSSFGTPWWSDEQFLIGHLSKKKRRVRVVNQLTGQEHILDVGTEETLEEIQLRYLAYNSHAKSYTWKRLGRTLNLAKTLEENGIADESDELQEITVDADQFIPTVHVYFNDDLTVA